jgi:hypothetical protein
MTTRTPLSAYDVTGRYRFPSLVHETLLLQKKYYVGTTMDVILIDGSRDTIENAIENVAVEKRQKPLFLDKMYITECQCH